MARANYAVSPGIMVGIALHLGHRGTSGAPSIFHTFTLVWRHVTLL